MQGFLDITQVQEHNFEAEALRLFQFQYAQNNIYRAYCDALNVNPDAVNCLEKIPFLPIQFFKTHTLKTTEFESALIFESSTTTGMIPAKHHLLSPDLYTQSFETCFDMFYGKPENYCILGLLPSYLERKNSSLVYMVNALIEKSQHPQSGFYLYDLYALASVLSTLELRAEPVILIGVTYALLDFAEKFPMPLSHCHLVETGGMKGRRQELTREEVHEILQQKFRVPTVHSEYGMAELLSQAWSKGNGIFECPPWMKVLPRAEDDPLTILAPDAKRNAVLNIIDLANQYSCAFIATEDMGLVFPDGRFKITGRLDQSDLRGCGLMIV